ncbi:MAG: hypothetical protein ACQEVT_18555 [Pseudomonadota bacterium]
MIFPPWLTGPKVRHRAGCDPGGPKGHVIWPQVQDGVMRMSAAQMAALFEGLDWRLVRPERARRTLAAG